MTRDRMPGTDVTRRTLLAGAGLAGLASTVAGCAVIRSDAVAAARQEAANGDSTVAPASMAPGGGGAASPAAGGMAQAAGKPLGAVSEIPVGGGKVFTAAQVVVTQPAAGQFRAFSAVCTHAQCLVDKVAMGRIDCPCHGSQFSVKDGSVAAGPAPSPLPPRNITVQGGQITLA
ncbi:MAG: Rieske (2Fe-2S) protein [Gemmatimonadota bacterium]